MMVMSRGGVNAQGSMLRNSAEQDVVFMSFFACDLYAVTVDASTVPVIRI
jgi:hypothetical protein